MSPASSPAATSRITSTARPLPPPVPAVWQPSMLSESSNTKDTDEESRQVRCRRTEKQGGGKPGSTAGQVPQSTGTTGLVQHLYRRVLALDKQYPRVPNGRTARFLITRTSGFLKPYFTTF